MVVQCLFFFFFKKKYCSSRDALVDIKILHFLPVVCGGSFRVMDDQGAMASFAAINKRESKSMRTLRIDGQTDRLDFGKQHRRRFSHELQQNHQNNQNDVNTNLLCCCCS